jgi:YVTN family beta-propeller protein
VKTVAIAPDAGTHGITFGAEGKLLFVTNTGAGTVSMIDTDRNEMLTHIKVATAPEGIAFKRP